MTQGQEQALSPGQRQSLEHFYGALDTRDVALVDQALISDWEDIPLAPGQATGPEGIKPIFRMLISAFPDLSTEISEVLAEAGRAAARVIVTGTHRGDLFGLFTQIGAWPSPQRVVGRMLALQIQGYSDQPLGKLIEIPERSPGTGEVRVRVTAAALNPLDVKLTQGHMREWFPLTFTCQAWMFSPAGHALLHGGSRLT